MGFQDRDQDLASQDQDLLSKLVISWYSVYYQLWYECSNITNIQTVTCTYHILSLDYE